MGKCKEIKNAYSMLYCKRICAKALDADGFVFGTPVHYAAASGAMTSFYG